MENPEINNQNGPITHEPLVPANPPNPIQESPIAPPKNKRWSWSKKKTVLLSVVLGLVILMSGGFAYAYTVYIPNRPDVVLAKAVTEYVKAGQHNLTIQGKLDQADTNKPDFTFTLKTDDKDNLSGSLSTKTFFLNPEVEAVRVNGDVYAKFNGFEDSAKLHTHYKNFVGEDLQNQIASITDKMGIYPLQNQWLQIDRYFFDQPYADGAGGSKSTTEVKFSRKDLKKVEKVSINGKQAYKYTVTLTKQQLGDIAQKLSGGSIVSSEFDSFASRYLTGDNFTLTLWADISTKTLVRAEYNGKPYNGSTLNLTLESSANIITKPDNAVNLFDKVGFSTVHETVFNPSLQKANDFVDQMKIADIKGMKTAFEIYKRKYGHYPDRYEVAVNGYDLYEGQMDGVSFNIFWDENGTLVGKNGSSYAYVPQLANGSEDCGGGSPTGASCQKFFVITTLSNGKEYQLNSD